VPGTGRGGTGRGGTGRGGTGRGGTGRGGTGRGGLDLPAFRFWVRKGAWHRVGGLVC